MCSLHVSGCDSSPSVWQMRLLWSPRSDYKTTEDLSCCYATFQQCNYLTTWCPQCPQFCCPLCSITSLCSSAVTQQGIATSMCSEWPPPHQENKYNPRIILRARLMSQSCFPIWKTAGLFCWFFSWQQFVQWDLLQEENEYICSPCHSPREEAKSIKAAAEPADKPLLFPRLQHPSCPSHCSYNLSSHLKNLFLKALKHHQWKSTAEDITDKVLFRSTFYSKADFTEWTSEAAQCISF